VLGVEVGDYDEGGAGGGGEALEELLEGFKPARRRAEGDDRKGLLYGRLVRDTG
jgi:hypothetical protein